MTACIYTDSPVSIPSNQSHHLQVKALFFPEHYPSLEYADSNPFTAGSDLLAIAVPEDAFTGIFLYP